MTPKLWNASTKAYSCLWIPGGAVTLLPPFPIAPRERRAAQGGSLGRSLSLLTKHTPYPLTWCHFTPWTCILSSWVLETSPHHKHGLGANCIPVSFPLVTEEDPTGSSGNLLWHRSEVTCKWGVPYFQNLESVEGDTFGNKSGKHSSREEYSQSKWQLWSTAEIHGASSLEGWKVGTLQLYLLPWGWVLSIHKYGFLKTLLVPSNRTGASSLMGFLRLIQSAMQKGADTCSPLLERQPHHLPPTTQGEQRVPRFRGHNIHLGNLLSRQLHRLLSLDLVDQWWGQESAFLLSLWK